MAVAHASLAVDAKPLAVEYARPGAVAGARPAALASAQPTAAAIMIQRHSMIVAVAGATS